MTPAEADTVLALLRHLDGSQVLDETDLLPDVLRLSERAANVLFECNIIIDEDVLLDTLGQVAQRHADAANYAKDYEDDDIRLAYGLPVAAR